MYIDRYLSGDICALFSPVKQSVEADAFTLAVIEL
jgi:hypothetical protein